MSLYRKLQNRFENHGCKIGIITPYNSQRKLLKHRFRNIDSSCHRVPADVEISTIDGFQGREVDIVIFSCVRSGSGGSLGFLAEWQRLNVAITRAKVREGEGEHLLCHVPLPCLSSNRLFVVLSVGGGQFGDSGRTRHGNG